MLEPDDIFMFVDPATDWPLALERAPCLTVAYLIDVHLNLGARLHLAQLFDSVFVAQKAYVPLIAASGHPRVHWLPLACDPEVHHQPAEHRTFDVGFVGKLGHKGGTRYTILSAVLPRYATNDTAPFYAREEMARVYGQSKIVFNASINGDLNMRFFEALASGALLVTDRIDNGVSELFQEDVHYVGYSTIDEAIEKIDYYLAHPAERDRIAAAGCAEVLARHTYRNRWAEIERISATAYGAAPARRYSAPALGQIHSDIFSGLRRPGGVLEVMRHYGPSVGLMRKFGASCGRWINARVPLTAGAIRARMRSR
jgi:hypothetical protein